MSFIQETKKLQIKKIFESTEHVQVVINGYEGCSKSRTVIEVILDIKDLKGTTVYACKSYSMLKDKQKEIMHKFSFSEREVPIIALNRNEDYTNYYTNSNYPYQIPSEAKILLLTQSCLMRQQLVSIINRSSHKPKIKLIVLDEFDPAIGIIPSIDFSRITFWNKMQKDTQDRRISNEKFLKMLEEEYSHADYIRQRLLCENSENNTPLIAQWILDAKKDDIKVVVLTSERLATELLSSIGFQEFSIDYESDFSNDIVNIAFNDGIGKAFFTRLNSEMAWNHFGFDTIISDNYNSKMNNQKITEIETNITNHTVARGSNLFDGRLLTIMSAIPSSTIKAFQDSINFFCKSNKTFDEVERKFYRDRLMQAVGRVIGYRGNWKNNHETWIICNSYLGTILFDFNKDSSISVNKDLKIPYSFKIWDPDIPIIEKIIESVKQDKRVKIDSLNNSLTEKKDEIMHKNFEILSKRFRFNKDSVIPEEDLKLELEKINVFSVNNKLIQTKKLCDMFPGAFIRNTTKRLEGKLVLNRYVHCIEIIEEEKEKPKKLIAQKIKINIKDNYGI